MELFQTLVGALIGGGLLGLVQFLIKRSDEKADKKSGIFSALKTIEDRIAGIETRLDKENADDARRNILAFDDELRRKMDHSEESFNQVLDDINYYARYCRDNPKYENNKATAAITHIREVYQRVKDQNKFI